MVGIYLTVEKRAKRMPDTTVKTTPRELNLGSRPRNNRTFTRSRPHGNGPPKPPKSRGCVTQRRVDVVVFYELPEFLRVQIQGI